MGASVPSTSRRIAASSGASASRSTGSQLTPRTIWACASLPSGLSPGSSARSSGSAAGSSWCHCSSSRPSSTSGPRWRRRSPRSGSSRSRARSPTRSAATSDWRFGSLFGLPAALGAVRRHRVAAAGRRPGLSLRVRRPPRGDRRLAAHLMLEVVVAIVIGLAGGRLGVACSASVAGSSSCRRSSSCSISARSRRRRPPCWRSSRGRRRHVAPASLRERSLAGRSDHRRRRRGGRRARRPHCEVPAGGDAPAALRLAAPPRRSLRSWSGGQARMS